MRKHKFGLRPTLEAMEDRLVMSTVPSFSATALSGTQVQLSWAKVPNATQYPVYEVINNKWALIAIEPSNTTVDIVNGLKPNTTYTFDVQYVTAGHQYGMPVKSVTTPPGAPTWWDGIASCNQINIGWSPVAGATVYYVVRYVNSSWTVIGSTTGTGFAVRGLNPNTTYTFDVCAANNHGGTWGTVKSATTYQVPMYLDNPGCWIPSSANQNIPVDSHAVYNPVYGPLWTSAGPQATDVRQGDIGDCWLLSTLACAAQKDPSLIVNMFKYDGVEPAADGKGLVSIYAVTFFSGLAATSGDAAKTVYVSTELPNGGGLYDQPVNSVLWVALAEKAYVIAANQGIVNVNRPLNNNYWEVHDGFGSNAMHAITNHVAVDVTSFSASDVSKDYTYGDLVCLATPSTPSPSDSHIVGGHYYAVLSVTAQTNYPYEIFNPWGIDESNPFWAYGTKQTKYGLFDVNAPFINHRSSYENFDMMSVCLA